MKSLILFSIIEFCAACVYGQETPTFAKYPASIEEATARQFTLTADQVKLLDSNPEAQDSRRSLEKSFSTGVNFAGHFMVASWSCGAGCTQGAIIDGGTGEVFLPPQLNGIGPEEGPSFGCSYYEWSGKTLQLIRFVKQSSSAEVWDKASLEYRKDSRLLIINGSPGGS